MSNGELELIRWLEDIAASRRCTSNIDSQAKVRLDIGDDLAIIQLSDGQDVLLGSDMMLDGKHFDSKVHTLDQIGRKALSCCLSDCAAMAVRPVAAVISLALPAGRVLEMGKSLLAGMMNVAEKYGCRIVGGDTTSWNGPLAIDVAITAAPWDDCRPATRRGALPDDVLFVTGRLGGSRIGRHMSFQPRVNEAHRIAQTLGSDLHAMIDISDGLSLDLHRLCSASQCGARLREDSVNTVISTDAFKAAQQDGRTPLEHALGDGEDFELLFAASVAAEHKIPDLGTELCAIGCITADGFEMQQSGGQVVEMTPEGFEH